MTGKELMELIEKYGLQDAQICINRLNRAADAHFYIAGSESKIVIVTKEEIGENE